VISLSSLNGIGYVALISPLFVYALLSKGSGIPLLERSADKKWGSEPEYQAYKNNTPVLFPKLFNNIENTHSNSD
jgi:steroid 5-alpha reductase family enzyme